MRLTDIIRYISDLFEKKRKNPIQLDKDSNLESNLKFLKVSDKATPIQISEDTVNIQGSLNVNGSAVQTGTDAGATQLNELSDVTYSSGDLTIDSLDTIVAGALTIDSSADITLDAAGSQVNIDNAGTTFGTIDTATVQKLKIIGTTDYQVSLNSTGGGDILIASADNIRVDAVDSVIFDSDGTYIMSKDGTEFSAANSAYAGMILGYSVFRNLTGSPGNEQITISTSMTVLQTAQGNALNISFVAPPSGKVEIVLSALFQASSRSVAFSLSDNATYNEVNAIHTYDGASIKPDETDYTSIYVPFVVEGLTAGTSYQYWIAAKSSSGSVYIYQGVDRTGAPHSQPIVIKATALPATIVNEE